MEAPVCMVIAFARQAHSFHRSQTVGEVIYLLAIARVLRFASVTTAVTADSGIPGGGSSSAIEVRRSPKQTMHVSAMS